MAHVSRANAIVVKWGLFLDSASASGVVLIMASYNCKGHCQKEWALVHFRK